MSPTIRSLVIPCPTWTPPRPSTPRCSARRTWDQPYYVGYNVDSFEVALAPGDVTRPW